MEFNIKKDLLATKSYNLEIIIIYISGAGDNNIKLYTLCMLLCNVSNHFFNKLIGSFKKLKINNLNYNNYFLYLLVAFIN